MPGARFRDPWTLRSRGLFLCPETEILVTSKSARTFKEELTRRGLNLEQAAVLAGVSTGTISRIVNGKARARPDTVVAVARALNIGAARMRNMMEEGYLLANPDEDPRRPELTA